MIETQLLEIQTELKAPKDKRNDFGKYNYRSCESILEAAKPICRVHNCTLTLSDDIFFVGERYYVKATACLVNDKGEKKEVTAFAREPLDKKGMDASQITGTSSSYARKYALCGLLCLDDTKDADTNEYHEQTKEVENKTTQAAAERLAARAECQKAVRMHCQTNNVIEKDVWVKVAEHIGKASKDFTTEDWKAGQTFVEGLQ